MYFLWEAFYELRIKNTRTNLLSSCQYTQASRTAKKESTSQSWICIYRNSPMRGSNPQPWDCELLRVSRSTDWANRACFTGDQAGLMAAGRESLYYIGWAKMCVWLRCLGCGVGSTSTAKWGAVFDWLTHSAGAFQSRELIAPSSSRVCPPRKIKIALKTEATVSLFISRPEPDHDLFHEVTPH